VIDAAIVSGIRVVRPRPPSVPLDACPGSGCIGLL